MVLEIAGISVVLNVILLLKFRKNQIVQQLAFLFVFIVGLTFVGELDVLLPVYFLFSSYTFAKNLRTTSKIALFIFTYYGYYLIFGMIFQDTVATIVSFVAKYWQIMVFFLVINTTLLSRTEPTLKQLNMALLLETLLGFYLMFTSSLMEDNGLVRLVSNAQPITGNIAVATLPLSVYLYFKNKGNVRIETKIIVIELLFLVWIVLSGTRGYTLMFAGTMFIVFCDYWINNQKAGKVSKNNRILIAAFIACLALIIVIVVPAVSEKIVSILRLKDSTGIRTFENAAEWNFFKDAPWYIKLFGIGLGGTAGNYDTYVNAILGQVAQGMWNQDHYLYDAGAPFHNWFANILLNLGMVGIMVVAAANIWIWKITSKICVMNTKVKWIFHFYQICFLLMNYFRWSAACGISEMIFFAMILKIIKQKPFLISEVYSTQTKIYPDT